jgi:GNAT superfamily N-acetyltransferase
VTFAEPAFGWESQAAQWLHHGEPGISFERHSVGTYPHLHIVDCLLYRDEEGLLVGLLYHYCDDSRYEEAGNVNIMVKPENQRRGIGTALLVDAMARWNIDLSAQNLTLAGAFFLRHLSEKGIVEL